MLLGMETGAFKAANAVYIVTGSAMVRTERGSGSWVLSLEGGGFFVERPCISVEIGDAVHGTLAAALGCITEPFPFPDFQ